MAMNVIVYRGTHTDNNCAHMYRDIHTGGCLQTYRDTHTAHMQTYTNTQMCVLIVTPWDFALVFGGFCFLVFRDDTDTDSKEDYHSRCSLPCT